MISDPSSRLPSSSLSSGFGIHECRQNPNLPYDLQWPKDSINSPPNLISSMRSNAPPVSSTNSLLPLLKKPPPPRLLHHPEVVITLPSPPYSWIVYWAISSESSLSQGSSSEQSESKQRSLEAKALGQSAIAIRPNSPTRTSSSDKGQSTSGYGPGRYSVEIRGPALAPQARQR
ncbi:hypothetical protein Tco_0694557 [Tanacetum coccineum]